ncbi:alpha/beta hydrolase [Gibbsiella dentisursi]|uniref:Alpha/beta hydrolase n=1 Tax=Gibbsiella dentisursi TaxID=796890 RepID=A0ABP7LMS1_9GAMM
MSENNEIIIEPVYGEGPLPYYPVVTDRKDKNVVAKIYKRPERVIPVIFLPGVMGSNLKNENGDAVWLANSTTSWDLLTWIGKNADQRKKILNPDSTSVFNGGNIEPEGAKERVMFKSRQDRGWGEVAAMSYGTFLPWLQDALNDHDSMIVNKMSNNGKKTLREELMDMNLNAEKGESSLTDSEVALSYKYLFPVHAMGYNWLQSNLVSAEIIKKRIEKTIQDYQSMGYKCEKIILVTHSMGGLVARCCSELQGGNKDILGIVHGVMPDSGSPMAYKRMKTGEAGRTGWVIGSNGAEMTAVLAQSPGPLQLLPGFAYGPHWLRIDGMVSLPKSDPYKEIYLERRAWWGLCEERFINPENKEMDKNQFDDDWDIYKDLITNYVKPGIEDLRTHYHKNTWMFYGNNGSKFPSYSTINWKGVSGVKYKDSDNQKITSDGVIFYPPEVNNKTTRIAGLMTDEDAHLYKKFTLLPPDADGDGTVPVRGAVFNAPGLKSQIGLSVDHEGAYKDDESMDSRRFTLRAVLKIAQEIKETGLAYADE